MCPLTHAHTVQKSQRGMEGGAGGRERHAPHRPSGPSSGNDSATFPLVSPHIFCHASSKRSDPVCGSRFRNAAAQQAAFLPLQVATTTLQSTAALICNSALTVVSTCGVQPLLRRFNGSNFTNRHEKMCFFVGTLLAVLNVSGLVA